MIPSAPFLAADYHQAPQFRHVAKTLTFYFAQGEHTDGLQGRYGPRDEMEQMRTVFYGLVAPFEAGGQEPG